MGEMQTFHESFKWFEVHPICDTFFFTTPKTRYHIPGVKTILHFGVDYLDQIFNIKNSVTCFENNENIRIYHEINSWIPHELLNDLHWWNHHQLQILEIHFFLSPICNLVEQKIDLYLHNIILWAFIPRVHQQQSSIYPVGSSFVGTQVTPARSNNCVLPPSSHSN